MYHGYVNERQHCELHMVGKRGGGGNDSEPDQGQQPPDLQPTLWQLNHWSLPTAINPFPP